MTNKEAMNRLDTLKDCAGVTVEIKDKDVEAFKIAIKALENERPKGEWIDTGSGQECNVCHEIQYGYDNFRHFCANCGAKMKGGADMRNITEPPSSCITTNPNSVEAYYQSLKGGAE